jgi:hypothetical protein
MLEGVAPPDKLSRVPCRCINAIIRLKSNAEPL